jgi:two-component system chemotaxis response regulator CheY
MKRILVIDRDRRFQRYLAALLASPGYEVETDDHLTPALQRMKDVRFDCLIMNASLPEMKGYEAVPIVKTIDRKIKVIMTADENTMELESRVREQDIFYYYIKSFDIEELRTAVYDALKSS